MNSWVKLVLLSIIGIVIGNLALGILAPNSGKKMNPSTVTTQNMPNYQNMPNQSGAGYGSNVQSPGVAQYWTDYGMNQKDKWMNYGMNQMNNGMNSGMNWMNYGMNQMNNWPNYGMNQMNKWMNYGMNWMPGGMNMGTSQTPMSGMGMGGMKM